MAAPGRVPGAAGPCSGGGRAVCPGGGRALCPDAAGEAGAAGYGTSAGGLEHETQPSAAQRCANAEGFEPGHHGACATDRGRIMSGQPDAGRRRRIPAESR